MSYQTTSRGRDRARVRALLWLSGIDATAPAAPGRYGGQSLDEQERNVKEHAQRDGVTLGENDLFAMHVPSDTPLGDRLAQILAFVADRPTDALYIPGSIFADLNFIDQYAYVMALYKLGAGTKLIICSDE